MNLLRWTVWVFFKCLLLQWALCPHPTTDRNFWMTDPKRVFHDFEILFSRNLYICVLNMNILPRWSNWYPTWATNMTRAGAGAWNKQSVVLITPARSRYVTYKGNSKMFIKARQISLYVMVSLWCESLLTNTRFRILFKKMNSCEALLMLYNEKELPNDSGRPLRYHNFTDKKAEWLLLRSYLFLFLLLYLFFFCFLFFISFPWNHSKSVYKWL